MKQLDVAALTGDAISSFPKQIERKIAKILQRKIDSDGLGNKNNSFFIPFQRITIAFVY